MKAILVIDIPDEYKDLDLYYEDGWICAKGISPDFEFKGLLKFTSLHKLRPLPEPRELTEASEYNPWIDENAMGFNECLAKITGETE